MTDEERHRLDAAVVSVSLDPAIGGPLATTPLLRDYRHANAARLIYYATTLGTVVIVVYVEV